MKQYIRMTLFTFTFLNYYLLFLEPGHEVHIVVTSAKDVKLTPVRDAFTHVFGRATTQGIVGLIDFLFLFRLLNFIGCSIECCSSTSWFRSWF
jgi:hypothetical protein